MIFRSIIIISFLFFCIPAMAQFKLDLESGVVFGTNYNKVRIPATGGTLVNLANELDIIPKIFYRIRAGYTLSNRHNISILYAPLTVKYNGNFNRNINFNNIIFNADQPVNVFYKFNSYRLTYRYDFIAGSRWRVGAGLTGKIRDADIRFKNESGDTHYDDLGFIFLRFLQTFLSLDSNY